MIDLGSLAGLHEHDHALAEADDRLCQTSVLWGPGGDAFSVSHQSVAIFG
jgi:hypothetical protein